jgi:hypothetical protein
MLSSAAFAFQSAKSLLISKAAAGQQGARRALKEVK